MMPEKTGVYFLATSLEIVFSVVADFGITSVLIRQTAKHPEEAKSFAQKALGLKIVLTILAIVGLYIASDLLGYDGYLRFLIALASIILALDSLQVFLYAILRGQQDLRFEAMGMIVGMFVTALGGGLVLLVMPSLPLLIVALMLGSFVNVCVSTYGVVCRFGWDVFHCRFDKAFAKTLFVNALPFALAAIFVKVYSYVDSIMISKFLGTAHVGLYSIAYKFTYAFQFLPLAFIAGLYPSLSATIKHNPAELPKLFERSMWYMMLIATPITLGLWLVAPEAVLLVGHGYVDAGPILQMLVLVLFPIFLDFPIGSLLNAADRQSTKTIIMGFTMITNVTLNFFLIPIYGVLGAAYAALISFTFMFFVGLTFVQFVIKHYSYGHLALMLSKIAISGCVMLIVGIFLIPMLDWIATIPICGVVYMIALFFTRSIHHDDLTAMRRLITDKIS